MRGLKNICLPCTFFRKLVEEVNSQCEGVNKERQCHVIQEAGTQYKREAGGLPRMTTKGEAGGQLCIDMGAASPDGQVRRFQEEFLPEGETDKSIRYFWEEMKTVILNNAQK